MNFMNNFSDKNVIIIILGTIFLVFTFIFSVKSPERKVIESPILWKEEVSTLSFLNNNNFEFKNYSYLKSF